MQIFGLKINIKDVLACPARFERATYALEEFVAAGKSIYSNDLDS
ncbi:hypothetical protein [Polynucleobacter sp.]